MNRDTYVVHNAFFDSGGPYGKLGSTVAGYIETATGRDFASFFNILSGASMGGVNAMSLSLRLGAVRLMYSTYACIRDLIDRPSESVVRNQLLNKKFGLHLSDHFDHQILYHMLEPHYSGRTMGDLPNSLLAVAHNMTKKRTEFLGKMDTALFDESALQVPLVNGSTKLIDGAMATTSIPGVFKPYTVHESHYRDVGTVTSAGQIHKEIDAALKSRHAQLQAARRHAPLSRRELFFRRSEPQGPLTLARASNALAHTLYLGTGDISDLPYTHDMQLGAGFLAAIDDTEYNALHAAKRTAQQQDVRDMKRHFDAQAQAVLGLGAITTINRSIIARPGTQEVDLFPSANQMDCKPANLHKIFYLAAVNVADNHGMLITVLDRITKTQLAQGDIDAQEHRRMNTALEVMARTNPWRTLEKIIVTDKNGAEIYEKYRRQAIKAAPRRPFAHTLGALAAAVGVRPRQPQPQISA